MSALKEISEIPENKKKRVGEDTRPRVGSCGLAPDGQSLSPGAYLHEGFFASPSEETQGVRLPMSPEKSGCNSGRRAGAPDHRPPPWVGGHATTGRQPDPACLPRAPTPGLQKEFPATPVGV